MKLLQKHYLFIFVMALLSLLLGIVTISNTNDKKSSSYEYGVDYIMTVSVGITDFAGVGPETISYQNTYIYGAYPRLKLELSYDFKIDGPWDDFLAVEVNYNEYDRGKIFKSNSGTMKLNKKILHKNSINAQVYYSLRDLDDSHDYDPDEYYDVSVKLNNTDANSDFAITKSGQRCGISSGNNLNASLQLTGKSGCRAEFYQKPWEGAEYQRINALDNVKYGEVVYSDLSYSVPSGYRFNGWNAMASARIYFFLGDDGKIYTDYHIKDGIIEDNLNWSNQLARIYEKPGETSKFYAIYAQNYYTINFDYNYTGKPASKTSADLKSTYPYTISEIFGNAPTRTGYTFAGWNTQADGKGTNYTSSITQDVNHGTVLTLYAQWTPNTYTIKYYDYDDDGITVLRTDTCTYDVSKTLLNPTKTGHYFLGWKLDNNATKVNYTGGQSVIYLTSTNGAVINLYAHWEVETYTIMYIDNDHDGFPTSTSTVTYGKQLKIPIPTKNNGLVAWDEVGTNDHWLTGHYFDRWQCTADGYTYIPETITIPDWGDNGAEVVFNAVWGLERYYINFDLNYETEQTIERKTVGYNRNYNLTVPTRTGYEFGGWCYDGEVQSNPYIVRTDFGKSWTEVTFIAQWTPITYTVVFDKNSSANDVTGTINNIQNKKYNEEFTLPNNTYVRNNGKWLFTGWSTTSTGTVAYTNGQTVKNLTTTNNATVRLYAVWRDTWANHTIQPVLKNKNNANSKDNPYLIQFAGNLAWMSEYLYSNNSALSGWYLQTANINLSSYEWLPIGYDSVHSFTGCYDGKGYTITGLKINGIQGVTRHHLGLFGYTKWGNEIKNIHLRGSITVAYSGDCIGSIAGRANFNDIINCTSFVTINTKSEAVGGIVGYGQDVKLLGCQMYGNVTANTRFGGILGVATGTTTINNCYIKNKTSSSQTNNVKSGGIVGSAEGDSLSISSCAFEGTTNYVSGLLLGYANDGVSLNISNCFVNAVINNMTINKENDYGLSCKKGLATNCVSVINSVKRYIGSDFSNWVISPNGTPMPSGLTWLGNGGVKATLKDIQDYVKS